MTGPRGGPVIGFIAQTFHNPFPPPRWKTQFDKTCAKKALYVALYGLLEGLMIQ